MSLQYQDCVVTVGLGKGPDGTEKSESKTYKQIVRSSVSTDDILTLLQDSKTAEQLISDWYYGQDLRAKSAVRQEILAAQPPSLDKAFEAQVKSFIKVRAANGKPVTEEQARKVVKAMMDAETE